MTGSLITLTCSAATTFVLFSLLLCCHPSPTPYMSPCPLPQWHPPTQPLHGRISCRRNGFSHPLKIIPGIGISLGCFLLVGLIFYLTFFSPHGPLLLSSSKWSIPTYHASSSPTSDEPPSSLPEVLSLEQIRDVVDTTRGFFSKDYSLYLGWNNVSVRDNLPSQTDDPKTDAIYSRLRPPPSKFA